MRRCLLFLVLACISLPAIAQNTIPGTFTRQTAQNSTAIGGYVVAPPSIDLGNGLSPAVITNPPTFELASNSTDNSNTSNDLTPIPLKRFDFIVAAPSYDQRSLAELVQSFRGNRVQASKVYTNEDITAMYHRRGSKPATAPDNMNAATKNTGGITGVQPQPQSSQPVNYGIGSSQNPH